MNNTNNSSSDTKRRAGLAAAVLAATTMFGALGNAAIASAEPRPLNIDQLANCENDVDSRAIQNNWSWAQWNRELRKCCLNAGGEYTADDHCIAQDEERSPDTGPPTKPGVPSIPSGGPPPPKSAS
ncbi:hypothetical protein [Mycobacterium sp. 1274761.0]|uniref:hypothetical protein n=1 Tax=Mycobacterium sp. 1274761.0 TaxID=1834077 RepID=UPI0012E8A94A|nr:hypothetical protein [Mycobacterium sp. 1274761.0]